MPAEGRSARDFVPKGWKVETDEGVVSGDLNKDGAPDAVLRLVEDLLGLRDDVRFRKAERLYVRGHLPARTFAQEKARLAARGGAVELLDQTMNGEAGGRR